MNNAITDVPGIKVGHASDLQSLTGCTVVLCPRGAVAGVDVRGSAPGTRETDLLRPGHLVEKIHGVVLTGGSAFGLESASGAVRFLHEMGVGYDTGVIKVPIVPAAVIFDFFLGSKDRWPDAVMGYEACTHAREGRVPEGNVGAGTGATVGKALGPKNATKSGVGTASLTLAGGGIVGALAVVNAFGHVRDPQKGRILAGPRKNGVFCDSQEIMFQGIPPGFHGETPTPGTNTTIAVVATSYGLTKDEANKVAGMAHDGLARTIYPIHTMYDGDAIFCLSTGKKKGDVSTIGAAAAAVIERAVIRAVEKASGLGGLPGPADVITGLIRPH